MAGIVIISCEKIKDVSCVSCMKCFKSIREKAGEFARYENQEIDVVAMGGCGGCPGLVMPKLALVHDLAGVYSREIDVIHLGTCVVKATTTAGCPIKIDDLVAKIGGKFNKEVVIGTHPW
jgi:predicted metal-binding protein